MSKPAFNVCVFCGSSDLVGADYLECAAALGRELVGASMGLIYGGASVGMMGRLANEVLDQGGYVTGVVPKSIYERVGHRGLSETVLVDSMHERKSGMYELADAFVALPGGLGTLEELFEILTWQQLGFHKKPCGLLNTRGYFRDLLRFLDHIVAEGFLKPLHRDLLLVGEQPGELLERLKRPVSGTVSKWDDNG